MILVIGSDRDFHARYILGELHRRGKTALYLDTMMFPEKLKMSLDPMNQASHGVLRFADQASVALSEIQSVYWRYHHGVFVSPEVEPELSSMVYRENSSALGSLFRMMPHVRWVNPVEAIEGHQYKPHQLALISQMGILIPDTLISNDPEAVKAFYEKHAGKVIYKPVRGGAHTQMLTVQDLSDERLHELRHAPVQFQQYIAGENIRVYVVGDALFAAEIRAETLDFRDQENAPIVSIDLPEAIQHQCYQVAEALQYVFTGIDIRRTPEGEYFFLEGNPSPMFIHFEKQTEFPITQALTDLLCQQ